MTMHLTKECKAEKLGLSAVRVKVVHVVRKSAREQSKKDVAVLFIKRTAVESVARKAHYGQSVSLVWQLASHAKAGRVALFT